MYELSSAHPSLSLSIPLPFSLSVYDCVRELVIKKIFKMAKPKATSSQHELQKNTHTHTQNESALLPCVCKLCPKLKLKEVINGQLRAAA